MSDLGAKVETTRGVLGSLAVCEVSRTFAINVNRTVRIYNAQKRTAILWREDRRDEIFKYRVSREAFGTWRKSTSDQQRSVATGGAGSLCIHLMKLQLCFLVFRYDDVLFTTNPMSKMLAACYSRFIVTCVRINHRVLSIKLGSRLAAEIKWDLHVFHGKIHSSTFKLDRKRQVPLVFCSQSVIISHQYICSICTADKSSLMKFTADTAHKISLCRFSYLSCYGVRIFF